MSNSSSISRREARRLDRSTPVSDVRRRCGRAADRRAAGISAPGESPDIFPFVPELSGSGSVPATCRCPDETRPQRRADRKDPGTQFRALRARGVGRVIFVHARLAAAAAQKKAPRRWLRRGASTIEANYFCSAGLSVGAAGAGADPAEPPAAGAAAAGAASSFFSTFAVFTRPST